MRSVYKLAALLPASLMLLAGCAKTDENIQFVRLKETTYSFLYKDNEPQTVAIEASGQWQAEASVSWIEIVEQTADGVVINVQDNIDATEVREGLLTITCGQAVETVYVYQFGNSYSQWTYRYPNQFDMGAVVSPNGRYIAGQIPYLLEDESWATKVIFIDTETGEWNEIAEVPKTLFAIQKPYAITDQGVAFFSDANGGGCAMVDIDGNIGKVEVVDGFELGGEVQCVSADGRLWAGWMLDKSLALGGRYTPTLWTDGVPEVLPIPELNYRNEPYKSGVMVRGMSHDGSVLYGSTWCDNDQGMVYWKKDASGKYQVDYVARDRIEEVEETVNGMTIKTVQVDGMTVTAQLTNISPNGKYIAGTYREENGSGNWKQYPGFFNTETGELTTFPDHEGGGATATDDGIGFVTNGTFLPTSGSVVDIENGVMLGSVNDWVLENYGMQINYGYITYVCPNGTLKAMSIEANAATPRTVTWVISPAPAND